jgi:hypothetical protein
MNKIKIKKKRKERKGKQEKPDWKMDRKPFGRKKARQP